MLKYLSFGRARWALVPLLAAAVGCGGGGGEDNSSGLAATEVAQKIGPVRRPVANLPGIYVELRQLSMTHVAHSIFEYVYEAWVTNDSRAAISAGIIEFVSDAPRIVSHAGDVTLPFIAAGEKARSLTNIRITVSRPPDLMHHEHSWSAKWAANFRIDMSPSERHAISVIELVTGKTITVSGPKDEAGLLQRIERLDINDAQGAHAYLDVPVAGRHRMVADDGSYIEITRTSEGGQFVSFDAKTGDVRQAFSTTHAGVASTLASVSREAGGGRQARHAPSAAAAAAIDAGVLVDTKECGVAADLENLWLDVSYEDRFVGRRHLVFDGLTRLDVGAYRRSIPLAAIDPTREDLRNAIANSAGALKDLCVYKVPSPVPPEFIGVPVLPIDGDNIEDLCKVGGKIPGILCSLLATVVRTEEGCKADQPGNSLDISLARLMRVLIGNKETKEYSFDLIDGLSRNAIDAVDSIDIGSATVQPRAIVGGSYVEGTRLSLQPGQLLATELSVVCPVLSGTYVANGPASNYDSSGTPWCPGNFTQTGMLTVRITPSKGITSVTAAGHEQLSMACYFHDIPYDMGFVVTKPNSPGIATLFYDFGFGYGNWEWTISFRGYNGVYSGSATVLFTNAHYSGAFSGSAVGTGIFLSQTPIQ